MKNSIALFPQLTKQQIKILQPRLDDFRVGYSDGQEEYELGDSVNLDNGRNVVPLVDDYGKWSPVDYGFICSGRIQVENCDILFGDDGIVSDDAVLGIAILWKSKSSVTRGSKQIGEIRGENVTLEADFEIEFGKASVRNNVELTFVLYLKTPGARELSISAGTVFGELYTVTLILEGMGSTFTVYEKDIPGDPLWSIECDWDDPESSQFSESVRVIINTGHNAWQLATDDDVRKELLKEIMASSMQIVIGELDPSEYDPSSDYEVGSVSAAISYFVSRAGIDTESGTSIAKSVRSYLDKTMK